MPRGRRRSVSPADAMSLDDDEDYLTGEDLSPISGRCPPQQRNAANARERARMRVLSKAFCRLKTTLPWVPADTKLSKLDTLRLASGYIAHLRALLADQPTDDLQTNGRPLNLTWPFTFQQGPWSSNVGQANSPQPPTNPSMQQINCNNHEMFNNNYYHNDRPQHQHQYNEEQNYYDQLNRDNGYTKYTNSMMHTG